MMTMLHRIPAEHIVHQDFLVQHRRIQDPRSPEISPQTFTYAFHGLPMSQKDMNKEKNESMVNIAKVLCEFLVLPGSSLLVDGKVKKGFFHAGAGVLAGLVLGIPGALLVAANSFSLSKTDRNLLRLLFKDNKPLASGRTHLEELEAKVKKYMKEGWNLEEIKSSILEDLEDIFAEEFSKKTTAVEPKQIP